ncbi:hypothetical protein NicSoilC12_15790 [Arthrobacter sp. NicSoilC12]|nr:hypothetical protein NicSoilC12_15790 [Arthrobacter sp. NicSoilC12]
MVRPSFQGLLGEDGPQERGGGVLRHEVHGFLAECEMLVDLALGRQERGLGTHQVFPELVGHG